MIKRCMHAARVLVLLAAATALFMTGCGSDTDVNSAAYFHEKGVALFNEGFYELLPGGKMDEANRNFEQAEKAFEQAVILDNASVESHRYLARVYALRKNVSGAADEMVKTIELDPENIDNYLILSSFYVRMKRYNDAEKALTYAKTLSRDPAAIDRINSLIHQMKEREEN
ncbi:MAG: tetratricopeptide repeat protein [Desulfobacterales bacterium]